MERYSRSERLKSKKSSEKQSTRQKGLTILDKLGRAALIREFWDFVKTLFGEE